MNAPTAPPFKLHGFTLGILWLLEEIKHPMAQGPETDAGGNVSRKIVTITPGDIARMIFIFSDPMAARAALKESRDVFDERAFAVVATLPIETVFALQAEIEKSIPANMLSQVPAAIHASGTCETSSPEGTGTA